MNTNAPIPPHEKALAMATKRAIEAAGGLKFCEGETGISDSQLSRCSNPHLRDSITIRDAVIIEHLGSEYHIVKAIARQLGLLVIPLPEAAADADGLAKTVMELAGEFGDVSRSIHDALIDGDCNSPEAKAALVQLDQMDEVSARLRIQLQRLAEQPTPLRRVGPKDARA